MKVYPYHTVLMEDERNRSVYHDHEDCPDGRRIHPSTSGRGRLVAVAATSASVRANRAHV